MTMLSLQDTRWQDLRGAYGAPYDVSVALRSMKGGSDVWDELWQELYHQGEVGEASYAAVPQLVGIADEDGNRDWNFYALLAVIEVGRHRKGNPPVPAWLRPSYDNAWLRLSELAVMDLKSSSDSLTIRSILSVIALAKGELKLGALLADLESSELDEWLEVNQAWSELYES